MARPDSVANLSEPSGQWFLGVTCRPGRLLPTNLPAGTWPWRKAWPKVNGRLAPPAAELSVKLANDAAGACT
ncbi:hypothetical protein D3C87_1983430 [compost metagenome]